MKQNKDYNDLMEQNVKPLTQKQKIKAEKKRVRKMKRKNKKILGDFYPEKI